MPLSPLINLSFGLKTYSLGRSQALNNCCLKGNLRVERKNKETMIMGISKTKNLKIGGIEKGKENGG